MKLTDSFEKVPGVYIIQNLVNGKYYIGESVNIKTRMYGHRAKNEQILHKALIKYGLENFDVEVYYLPDFDKTSLLDLEEQMIIKYDSLLPNGYNILTRGNCNEGFRHSEECKMRMSKLKLGNKMSDEAKRNMSIARTGDKHHMYGKRVSEKERIRLSTLRVGVPSEFKGKKHSEQSRKNMSEGCKERSNDHRSGIPHTKETREKISKSKIGKKMPPRTDETQRKITEGILKANKWKREHPHLVKPRKPKKALTEQGRINMSNAQKGKISPMKGKQMSDESKLKMSISAKKRVRKPHSEETKQKMRDAYIRRKMAKLDESD